MDLTERNIPKLLIAASLWSSAGCGGDALSPSSPSAAASAEAPLERVTVGRPTRKTLTLHTVQPATIEAFEETPLFSKLAGYVDAVNVDIGDRVTKNQMLATLWIPELIDTRNQQQALVEQAEADIAQADAGVVVALAGVKTAEAEIAGQQAGLTRASSQQARWKSESERIAQLVSTGVVTQKLADETLSQFRAAEGALDEAEAAILSAQAMHAQAQANVQKAEADRAAAAARLKVALASLAQAETMLRYTEIKAPYDGVVTQRHVDTQHYVHPAGGSQSLPLLVVAHVAAVRVYASIPETDAALVTSGTGDADPATVNVQALGNRSFDGRITRTSWSLDSSNRSLKVEIDLPNPDGVLRPGMYATIQLRLDEVKDVLAVPNAAIVRDSTGTFLCVVQDGVIDRRPVELGLRVGDDVQILAGIGEHDQIVLARAGGLTTGQTVASIQ